LSVILILVIALCHILFTYTLAVSCLPLIDPSNGAMSCALEDNIGVPFYEDGCSFTCNTGYELTGSSFRMCQSDGSWSGTEPMCRRGR